MTLIINKSNRDHEHRKEKPKKFYIILEQKPIVYFSEAGFFVPQKELAMGINDETTARMACYKMNELRTAQRQKVLCTLIHE